MRAVAIVLGMAVSLAVARPARAERLGFDPAAIYKVPRGSGPADGPANAPITIVAWSDHACGYCYRVQHTLDSLLRLYPGQIRIVHRTLPLDDENTASAEAVLAAAAQGRFRPMTERIYAIGGKIDRPGLELLARELGLDMVRFRAALDTGAYREQIFADVRDAAALGVTGTPSFFINGRPIHGNQPLRVFAAVVEQELARAAKHGGDYDALVAEGRLAADTPATDREDEALDARQIYRVGLGLPGHQRGPDHAPVTIVTWGDFQCQYCARMAPVLDKLHQKYGDQLRIVYRHLALPYHRSAALAAEAAVAAAEQGKFWPFHDQIYAQFGRLARADLEHFAEVAGLDLPRFRAALDERRYRDAVFAESATAQALGVDGTPTMFVNGQPISGSRDLAAMEKIVDDHLARVARAMQAGIQPRDVYAVLMSGAEGSERADPSRIPQISIVQVAMRAEDRSRSVAAACRLRDASRAAELAAGLTGEPRRRAALVCAASGIDIP